MNKPDEQLPIEGTGAPEGKNTQEPKTIDFRQPLPGGKAGLLEKPPYLRHPGPPQTLPQGANPNGPQTVPLGATTAPPGVRKRADTLLLGSVGSAFENTGADKADSEAATVRRDAKLPSVLEEDSEDDEGHEKTRITAMHRKFTAASEQQPESGPVNVLGAGRFVEEGNETHSQMIPASAKNGPPAPSASNRAKTLMSGRPPAQPTLPDHTIPRASGDFPTEPTKTSIGVVKPTDKTTNTVPNEQATKIVDSSFTSAPTVRANPNGFAAGVTPTFPPVSPNSNPLPPSSAGKVPPPSPRAAIGNDRINNPPFTEAPTVMFPAPPSTHNRRNRRLVLGAAFSVGALAILGTGYARYQRELSDQQTSTNTTPSSATDSPLDSIVDAGIGNDGGSRFDAGKLSIPATPDTSINNKGPSSPETICADILRKLKESGFYPPENIGMTPDGFLRLATEYSLDRRKIIKQGWVSPSRPRVHNGIDNTFLVPTSTEGQNRVEFKYTSGAPLSERDQKILDGHYCTINTSDTYNKTLVYIHGLVRPDGTPETFMNSSFAIAVPGLKATTFQVNLPTRTAVEQYRAANPEQPSYADLQEVKFYDWTVLPSGITKKR